MGVSHNLFSGAIPVGLGGLMLMRSMDLSFNQFSGSLPNLGSLTLLIDLDLRGNQFCGGCLASPTTLYSVCNSDDFFDYLINCCDCPNCASSFPCQHQPSPHPSPQTPAPNQTDPCSNPSSFCLGHDTTIRTSISTDLLATSNGVVTVIGNVVTKQLSLSNSSLYIQGDLQVAGGSVVFDPSSAIYVNGTVDLSGTILVLDLQNKIPINEITLISFLDLANWTNSIYVRNATLMCDPVLRKRLSIAPMPW
uniref:Uncharacterized protein n=1 Tax=Arcella intermedia TaxID=1963864 RepID=A0A6B2LDI5_9EUKA